MSIETKAITYTEFGNLSQVLNETSYTIDVSSLSGNQVLIKTLATPINPSDKVQILGVYAKGQLHTINDREVYIGGNEGLFRVEKVGPDSKLQTGDWVLPGSPGYGTWRTSVLTTDDDLIKISSDSDSLTFEQAATIAVNPPTALQLIEEIPDWNENDWIIQNMGGSQVSTYVTQIASHLNIKTISIVRSGKSQEYIDGLKALGATVVVSEDEFSKDDFFINLPKLTNHGKIRLALDSLGGPTTAGLVKALSEDGLLLTYGALSGQNISYPGGYQLLKNLTIRPYWLTRNTKANPQSKYDTINKVIEYYKNGTIKSVPFNTVEYNGNLLETYKKAIETSGKQVVVFP
jgi:trans-2-enoyl-CoA reductase